MTARRIETTTRTIETIITAQGQPHPARDHSSRPSRQDYPAQPSRPNQPNQSHTRHHAQHERQEWPPNNGNPLFLLTRKGTSGSLNSVHVPSHLRERARLLYEDIQNFSRPTTPRPVNRPRQPEPDSRYDLFSASPERPERPAGLPTSQHQDDRQDQFQADRTAYHAALRTRQERTAAAFERILEN